MNQCPYQKFLRVIGAIRNISSQKYFDLLDMAELFLSMLERTIKRATTGL